MAISKNRGEVLGKKRMKYIEQRWNNTRRELAKSRTRAWRFDRFAAEEHLRCIDAVPESSDTGKVCWKDETRGPKNWARNPDKFPTFELQVGEGVRETSAEQLSDSDDLHPEHERLIWVESLAFGKDNPDGEDEKFRLLFDADELAECRTSNSTHYRFDYLKRAKASCIDCGFRPSWCTCESNQLKPLRRVTLAFALETLCAAKLLKKRYIAAGATFHTLNATAVLLQFDPKGRRLFDQAMARLGQDAERQMASIDAFTAQTTQFAN